MTETWWSLKLAKITNAVLAEKMDNLIEMIKEDIKPAVRKNTEFRLKFKGVIASVSIIAAIIGGTLVKAIDKIFK